jgi:hypothetical protein
MSHVNAERETLLPRKTREEEERAPASGPYRCRLFCVSE